MYLYTYIKSPIYASFAYYAHNAYIFIENIIACFQVLHIKLTFTQLCLLIILQLPTGGLKKYSYNFYLSP